MAARRLNRGADPHRVAGFGALIGVIAFAFVMFAAPLESAEVFGIGVGLIGLGGGLFAHGTLTASMAAARPADRGLALGAWGAAQATAAGLAIALSRPHQRRRAARSPSTAPSATRSPIRSPASPSSTALEILLLLATIVAIGPLTRRQLPIPSSSRSAAPSIPVSTPEVCHDPRSHSAISMWRKSCSTRSSLFFAGLIWYLRQEDRREGYPLESGSRRRREAARLAVSSRAEDLPPRRRLDGAGARPIRPDARPLNAAKTEPWPGAPYRADRRSAAGRRRPGLLGGAARLPYKTAEGHDLIAPLRVATNYAVAPEGGNPLGFTVIGGDRKAAGTVKDIWVDRSESMAALL